MYASLTGEAKVGNRHANPVPSLCMGGGATTIPQGSRRPVKLWAPKRQPPAQAG
nr:MAG TPA: hypothetical protein [Caudoviricetes sp.]